MKKYPLNTIYFYVTEGCNLRCRHCWINPPHEENDDMKYPHIDLELFKDIVRQGKELGLSAVKLTGGEPLIHPQIEEILEYVQEEGVRLIIETNGVRCTPDLVERILKCKNVFVSVSLDGVDAETHEWVRGVEGCFDQAMEGIRNLVRAGYRPQIIMSVMRHNRHQIEPLVRMAEKEGANSVKLNIVNPTSRGEAMHNSGDTLSMKELIEVGEWVEKVLIPSSKIKVTHSHPSAFKSLSSIYEKDLCRCNIFGIIGVLANGKYALCGIGQNVPELIFGDAKKDKLSDVWNNNAILNEIKEGLPKKLKGICGKCLVKGACLGSCIAMNYYAHKDLFAPFWYCEYAHREGLFPETRIRPEK